MDKNKNWVFEGIGVSAVGVIILAIQWLARRKPQSPSPAPTTDGASPDIFDKLIKAIETRTKAELQLADKNEQIRQLTETIEALKQQQATEPAAAPRIDAALEALTHGDTAKAEAIFQEVLDRKAAEGTAANREAAAAARHLGSLVLLNDTQRALAAYCKAVELDPDDPDGWNQLGLLLMQTDDLTQAQAANDQLLSLGNRAADRRVIAAAYGNLGLIHQRRDDFKRAKEFLNKALALNRELGRKDGMAIQHANLGLVFLAEDNRAAACAEWSQARSLFAQIGMPHNVAHVEKLMAGNGCPTDTP